MGIGAGAGAAIGGALSAAGAVGSGLMGASAASGAAKTQAAAAQQAANIQQGQFAQTQGNLSPFIGTGTAASQALRVALGLTPANTPTAGKPGQYNVVGINGAVLIPNASPEQVASISAMNKPYLQIQQVQGATPDLSGAPDVLQQAGLPGMTYQPTFTPSADQLQFQPSWNPTQQDLTYTRGFDPTSQQLQFQPTYNPSQADLTFQPTQAQLEATPGYQWNLAQGLRGVESSGAAQGRGISGAALQGAAGWATGLASQTLGQQQQIFQANIGNQQTNQTQQENIFQSNLANQQANEAYNRQVFQGNLTNEQAQRLYQQQLFQQNLQNQFYNQGQQQGIFQANLGNIMGPLTALAGQGVTAASNLGQQGTQSAFNVGQSLTGAGNALAAGQVGSANALGGAATSLGGTFNSAFNNYLLSNALQSQTPQQQQFPSGGGLQPTQNNWGMVPSGGFSPSGNTWYG